MTLLFADQQVIVAYSEAGLQIYIHKLETITSKYGIKLSTRKTKTMAFKGRDPVRNLIVINNDITEQTNTFSYTGCFAAFIMKKMLRLKYSAFTKEWCGFKS
jgi:uncharacterized protein (DUF1330 family)